MGPPMVTAATAYRPKFYACIYHSNGSSQQPTGFLREADRIYFIRGRPFLPLVISVSAVLAGCSTTPVVQGGNLSSYEGLKASDGKITKARLHIDKAKVAAAKTINIAPTVFPPHIAKSMSPEQRALVANGVSRALCISLSDRFTVVAPNVPADLTVKSAITQATETNEVAAGLSVASSIGARFIPVNAPLPVPRVPYGLGNLAIEAEAVDRNGKQQAAMLWSRGATAFFSTPRISKAGDAYELSGAFGDDFATMLTKGESPFEGFNLDIPSWQKVNSTLGLAPKYAACENYGRAQGIAGFVGGKLGLPPEWTDDGEKNQTLPSLPF